MEVERHARRRIIEQHALNGVTLPEPRHRRHRRRTSRSARTPSSSPACVLRGSTSIGSRLHHRARTRTLIDAELGNNVTALHAYITTALVGDDVSIGPFAYLRPGTASRTARRSAPTSRSRTRTSARAPRSRTSPTSATPTSARAATSPPATSRPTTTAARSKSRTTIGNRVKTGVDTAFVAPVDVGDGAYTAAGSVITEDVPPGALAVARPEQKNIEGYAERLEKESGDGKP